MIDGWTVKPTVERVGVSWTTKVSLEYLELPKLLAIVPDWLHSGLPELAERHTVVVSGSNFTSFTECEINS